MSIPKHIIDHEALGLDGDFLKLDQSTPQTTVGTFTFPSVIATNFLKTPKIYPSTDSTTAVQINRADGTTNVLNVDTTNSRVGIVTTSPNYLLHVGSAYSSSLSSPYLGGAVFTADGGNVNVGLHIVKATDTATGDRPVFGAIRARGTLTSPTAVVNGDDTFSFFSSAYDGAAIVYPAQINFKVDGTVSSGNVPIKIGFVTGSNASNRAERLTISSTGNVGIGSTAPDRQLEINVGAATGGLRLTYNDANGSATTYSDFLIDSGGDLSITATGGDISFGDENLTTTGDIEATALITTDGLSTDFVKGDGSLDASTYLTDITAESIFDLSDFPADPNADKFLKWDDTAGALVWADAGGGGSQTPWTSNINAATYYLYNTGGIYDNAGTPALSIDPNNRILYASDGTTPVFDYSGTPLFAQAILGGATIADTTDAVNLTANCVSQIKMNDNAANTVVDDLVASDATLKGGDNTSAKSETGKINQALHLNGTDDYIETATATGLNSAHSFSMWLNLDSIPDYDTRSVILSQKNDRDLISITKVGTTVYIDFIYDNDPFTNYYLTTTTLFPTGVWQHLVLTWDGTNAKFYLNGNLIKTFALSITAGSNAIIIGANNTGGEVVDGLVDAFMFFNKALSQTEINSLYNNGTGTEATSNDFIPTSTIIASSAYVPTFATADNELAVQGDLEVNGNAYFQNDLYFDNTLTAITRMSDGKIKLPAQIQIGEDKSPSWSADSNGLKLTFISEINDENFAAYFQKTIMDANTSSNQAAVMSLARIDWDNNNNYAKLVGHRYRVEHAGDGTVNAGIGVWGTGQVMSGATITNWWGGYFGIVQALGTVTHNNALGLEGDTYTSGKIIFCSSLDPETITNADTNLYRSAANQLKTDDTFQAAGYKSSDGSDGATGSFTSSDGKTITVKNGLITAIT